MQSKIDELLQKPVIAINVGLTKFARSLEEQEVEVLQGDWVPPAGGDQEMMDLLDQLL
jgi:FdrA protein